MDPDGAVLRSLVERATDVILLLDSGGAIRYANPSAEELFGRPCSDLVGEAFGSVATSEQRSEIYVLNPGRGLVATSIRRAQFEVADRPYTAVYLRDITERVREEERLRQFEVAFDAISEGIIVTTPETFIVAVNRAFTDITGYSEEEALGRTPEFLRSGDLDKGFYDEIRRVLEREGHWEGEVRRRRKDGTTYLEWLRINSVYRDDEELICYVGVLTDVTTERALSHRANHDPLTELYNRYVFRQHLDKEMRRVERYGGAFSLIMLDLDNFKEINDRFGHHFGDEALRRVSCLAAGELRDVDVLARWGGEEFMVLLPETGTEAAAAVAERLRSSIAHADFEGPGCVTVSLGIAGSRAGESEQAMIRRVDRALYDAKNAGRNRWTVAADGDSRDDEREVR